MESTTGAAGGATRTLSSIIAAVARLDREGPPLDQSLRMSLLRNYTLESMLPLLKFYVYEAGLQPEVSVGDYDNILQEVLNPESQLYTDQLDLIVVSMILEHLDPRCTHDDWTPAIALQTTMSILEQLVQRATALIVVNTFLVPLHTEQGIDAAHGDHRVARVRELNAGIWDFARQHPGRVFVVDFERLIRMLGEEQSIDRRFWYMYRSPFTKEFAARYVAEIVKIGRGLKGRSKKVLILDCDNTLWRGVVGEDGMEGIGLDRHDYPGRCYYDFQQTVLNLIRHGVVVALCSKNNSEDVFQVLDSHPHCLIKRHHLAGWRINWLDKAENIASLADELKLGLDSFVFVDDNPIECSLVKELHPEVTVLQVPEATYDLPRLLLRDGLFDRLQISEVDRRRTELYVAAQDRAGERQQFASLGDFLRSLDLRTTVHAVTDTELPRVAQLIGKTNQFNLTTRRHTEAHVRRLASSDDARVFTLSASDRFGDLGLVGVLIALRQGEAGMIDTLLLSCRALGRGLETIFVDHCLSALEEEWAVDKWLAEYLPTKKNKQVEFFWDSMGFVHDLDLPEGKLYRAAGRSADRARALGGSACLATTAVDG